MLGYACRIFSGIKEVTNVSHLIYLLKLKEWKVYVDSNILLGAINPSNAKTTFVQSTRTQRFLKTI